MVLVNSFGYRDCGLEFLIWIKLQKLSVLLHRWYCGGIRSE
jgi:hypothetical protein